MTQNIVRIIRPPEPTLQNPFAQVVWIFYQVEREYEEPTAANFRYAKNKYLEYLGETHAHYSEVEAGGRFYLHKHWETDALIRFCSWLEGRLTSKTRYGLYKNVRRVMDFAYALRVIDTVVYHPPVFKGVRETDSRSAYSEEEQELIGAAIAKWISLAVCVLQGYQPTGLGVPYKKRCSFDSILVDGLRLEVVEAAKVYGVHRWDITDRLRQGWSAREAVGLDRRSLSARGAAQELVVEGQIFPSLSAAAKFYGLDHGIVGLRLRKGYTPEQALGIYPTTVQKSDERALLWAFENEYGCDAHAMLSDFVERKWSVVCTEKRMRSLFSRWGVWPYVDDRLVMPLAAELGALTGLNVEALKLLEIDSYQDEHGLTGEPVISYVKKRSGSETRSEDQALHLGLLEMEELFIPGEVTKKVKALINIILAITLKIRHHAPPELSRILFIFEDVEESRRAGKTIVVGIDPKGKTSTWYDRFKREEGLTENFGSDFRFNISRYRPTLATNMVLAGASLFQIQSTLGHGSIQTSATYLDEHQLQPAFNREVSAAMERIVHRSKEHHETLSQTVASKTAQPRAMDFGLSETLSGCGCTDPYSPSETVRVVTKHKAGTVCKFWNMCLFCDQAIITESSLPKIIVYRGRVNAALDGDSPSIQPRRELLKDVVKLIDGVLKDDVIFPKAIIDKARCKAVALDDVLVDQLIYHGL